MVEIITELSYGRLGNGNSADYIQQNGFVAEVALKSMEGYTVELLPFCECPLVGDYGSHDGAFITCSTVSPFLVTRDGL